MLTRRQFVAAGSATMLIATRSLTVASTAPNFPYPEFESRIGRRDFHDITKAVLPTPSMLVDLDLLEKNLGTMAAQCKQTRLAVRPHVKVHKSVDLARKQIAHGAIGLTCATIAEAELMSGAGLKNVLWTKQPASVNNIARAIALTKRDPTFMFVIEDPVIADWVEQAAAAANTTCRVVVAVYANSDRQGIENGQPALSLAQKVASSPHLRFDGYMGYSGVAAHTHGWDARRRQSSSDLEGLQQTVALTLKAGLPVGMISGGSTGTYNIDHENGLSELQAGSYVFMDTGYFAVGGKNDDKTYSDFQGALTVLVTVDGKHHPDLVTTDYGTKAMARSSDLVKGKPWLQVDTQGAEYGALRWKHSDLQDLDREPRLGDRFEIYCSNLDMSTNAFDRYYVARGDQIIDVWPIMGRTGPAQR
jgi:D-serine deaminase-like pyridoxal phosphate-dependent protein